MLIATLIGGAVATFARVVPAINNSLVPKLAVLATVIANITLVVNKFLEAAGIQASWLQWAPPSDGGAMAFAGWGLGSILQIIAAVVLAMKAQLPVQRAMWEYGDRELFYPDKSSSL